MNHTSQKSWGRRQEPHGVYLESINLLGTTEGAKEYAAWGAAALLAHGHCRAGIDRMPGT